MHRRRGKPSSVAGVRNLYAASAFGIERNGNNAAGLTAAANDTASSHGALVLDSTRSQARHRYSNRLNGCIRLRVYAACSLDVLKMIP